MCQNRVTIAYGAPGTALQCVGLCGGGGCVCAFGMALVLGSTPIFEPAMQALYHLATFSGTLGLILYFLRILIFNS